MGEANVFVSLVREGVPSEVIVRTAVLALQAEESGYLQSGSQVAMMEEVSSWKLPDALGCEIILYVTQQADRARLEAKSRRYERRAPVFIPPHRRLPREQVHYRLGERDWHRLSVQILRRDGHVCKYCGDREARFCIDHVVPLSRGGSNDPENLVVACMPCNSSKSDMLLSEWKGRRVYRL